ncbi:MAG TPA: tetratricopeptide repeat-containing glycosyltransferase family protein [Pirellulales bacterium]|jgi:Flp pilus assembly protein TadD|nr:tetratricopeptide repeat-containing glycosyltransferase family protein [Pirellulales bacterium]
MAFASDLLQTALGMRQAGQFAEAEQLYRRILEAHPRDFQALHGLGMLALSQGHFEMAIQHITQAIAVGGAPPSFHNNLGEAYRAAQQIPEARACYEKALQLDPAYGPAAFNLGLLEHSCGRLAVAQRAYELAARLIPELPEVHYYLGTSFHEQGRWAEALDCYATSLRLRPDYPEPHFNRSLVFFVQGRFLEGWQEHRWRSKCKKYPARAFQQPLWNGEPFANRTMLVYAEQGLGDTLQFVRYLPLVRERGGEVLLEVQAAIVPLLRTSGIQGVMATPADLPSFDLQVPLHNLPGIFQTTADNVPDDVPYLTADPELVAVWRERLSQHGGFKIGVAWQGEKALEYDRSRSIGLGEFAPLSTAPGVKLFSLQKNAGSEQLTEMADRFTVHDLGADFDESSGAFMDTAAVMKSLDLVITADTSVAHLAGALGVTTWVALPTPPDWRWLLEREDSPWYPTVRLFRQSTPGQWTDVFARMTDALRKWIEARRG